MFKLRPFELEYLLLEPFMYPLYIRVRKHLLRIARSYSSPPDILDVGGRKSHYTIGVPANITIIDLPRETEIQKMKKLGINGEIIDKTLERRSNVRRMLFDDMTRCAFPDNSFDCVVSVEVLEHVEEDDLFVRQVSRVLKPGGCFLMTTPNGEYFDIKEVNNPDNKRFYTREQLRTLLGAHFTEVEVNYSVPHSAFRKLGKKNWSPRRPLRTGMSMIGNFINSIEDRRASVRNKADGTYHLIAVAQKAS
jgi:SAM-dependent methyltransferase